MRKFIIRIDCATERTEDLAEWIEEVIKDGLLILEDQDESVTVTETH